MLDAPVLSIFSFNSIRVQQTNINDQVGGLCPSKQNYAIHFKGAVGAAYYDDRQYDQPLIMTNLVGYGPEFLHLNFSV